MNRRDGYFRAAFCAQRWTSSSLCAAEALGLHE
jgi:hypothetical protein